MNEYFVYALVDPRDGSIFYIGKGKNKRPYKHLTEALRYKNNTEKSINPYKTRKILNILDAGFDSYGIMYLHKDLTEQDAFNLEIEEINNYSNLTNISKGGLGGDNISNNPNYEEICKKISEGGKRRFQEHPEDRFKSARYGKDNGMFGKTHTSEVRQKIARCHTGTYEEQYGYERAKEVKIKVGKAVKKRFSNINNISWAVNITDEQLNFIKMAMLSGKYSWYLLQKYTGLTEKIIRRVCRRNNIAINVLRLTKGNMKEFYGEDYDEFHNRKSMAHRGKLNGRYKDGKQCKSYDNPPPVAV